jgi:DNA-binding CsgD family transcriptional regulator
MSRNTKGKFKSTVSAEEDARIAELYEHYGVMPVAKMVGRSHSFVCERLRAMGVTMRPVGQPPGSSHRLFGAAADAHSKVLSTRKKQAPGPVPILTYEEMNLTRRLYEEEGLSCMEIARALGLSSAATIYWRLQRFGVKHRSRSEAQKLYWQRHKRAPQPRAPGGHFVSTDQQIAA